MKCPLLTFQVGLLLIAISAGETNSPPTWSRPEKMERSLYVQSMDSTVKLRCLAEGSPKPLVSWTKDNVPIAHVKRLYGYPPLRTKSEGALLVIQRLMSSDGGNYTCLVQNPAGSISHSFIVEPKRSLNHVPLLIEKSNNLTVMVGMSAHFTCKFKTDMTAIIHWVRPTSDPFDPKFDRQSPDSYESIQRPEGGSVVGENLIIPSTKLSDSGIYFCIGRTNYGMTPGLLYLTVLEAHEAVYEAPRNVTSSIGSTVSFSCRAHIDLHKYISWIKIEEEGHLALANATEVLTIDNVTTSDAGIYACVVGSESTYFEYTAHLTVVNGSLPGGPFSVRPLAASFLQTKHLSLVAASISLMMILLIVTIIFVYRRLLSEKKKRRQTPVQTLVKKVIVERDSSERGGVVGESTEIITPTIKIVKQQSPFVNSGNIGRHRLGSDNTTLTMMSEYELPFDPEWEVPRSRIKVGKILGEGAFGKVVKGEVKDLPRRPGLTTVAIKMLKEGHTDSEMIDLVSEMTMMKIFGQHVNIINLLGVSTRDGPPYVIVEYAEHGNLKDFLRIKSRLYTNEGYEKPIFNNNHYEDEVISEKQLISFARQVCKGMEYLGSMKCIHRDLAARNVLVARDYTIKIADFGLARDVHADEYYKKKGGGILPVKWMSPEALFQRRYTTRSDVWSFGILLWEIMTLGASPYPSVPSIEKLFTLIMQGHRMEKPTACSADIYSIMLECWAENPADRPSFTELIDRLDRILVFARENDYLEMATTSSPLKECPGELVPRPPPICYSQLNTFSSPRYMNLGSSASPPPPFSHVNPTYAKSPFSMYFFRENDEEEVELDL